MTQTLNIADPATRAQLAQLAAVAIVAACRECGENPLHVAGRKVMHSRARTYAVRAIRTVYPEVPGWAAVKMCGTTSKDPQRAFENMVYNVWQAKTRPRWVDENILARVIEQVRAGRVGVTHTPPGPAGSCDAPAPQPLAGPVSTAQELRAADPGPEPAPPSAPTQETEKPRPPAQAPATLAPLPDRPRNLSVRNRPEPKLSPELRPKLPSSSTVTPARQAPRAEVARIQAARERAVMDDKFGGPAHYAEITPRTSRAEAQRMLDEALANTAKLATTIVVSE